MKEFLFHSPWWLYSAIVLTGAILALIGNSRLDATLRNLGLGIFAGGIVFAVLAYVIDTDIEKCENRTRVMIDSVVKQDWDKAAGLLDPYASLQLAGQTPDQAGHFDRQSILDAAKVAIPEFGVKSATITSTEAAQAGTIITVSIDLLTVQDATQDRPLPSSWQLEWQPSGGEWQLHRITLVRLAGQSGSRLFNPFH